MNGPDSLTPPPPPAPLVVGIGEILWDLLPDGKRLGGAPANFAYHARAQGAEGIPVSAVGRDPLGTELLAALEAAGLPARFVAVHPARPTGTVSVKLDPDGKPAYCIREGVAWDEIPESPDLLALAARCDAVCFGTLACRAPVSRAAIKRFLEAVPSGRCLRVYDINLRQSYYDAPLLRECLERCDVLKLNDEELPVLADALEMGAGSGEALLERLVARYSLQLAVLTRGPRGSLLLGPTGRSAHPGESVRQMADTVGAGDAFAAVVTMDFLRGVPLDAINAHANRVAAHVCSQPGAMPPLPADLCEPPVAK